MKALSHPDVAAKGNGFLTVDELRDYVLSEVPRLTDGRQHPTVDRDNFHQKFRFYIPEPMTP